MNCEHNNGFSNCPLTATWIGTKDGNRAFCDKHKELHASFEGEHFITITPDMERLRLEVIAAQKACSRCETIRKP